MDRPPTQYFDTAALLFLSSRNEVKESLAADPHIGKTDRIALAFRRTAVLLKRFLWSLRSRRNDV